MYPVCLEKTPHLQTTLALTVSVSNSAIRANTFQTQQLRRQHTWECCAKQCWERQQNYLRKAAAAVETVGRSDGIERNRWRLLSKIRDGGDNIRAARVWRVYHLSYRNVRTQVCHPYFYFFVCQEVAGETHVEWQQLRQLWARQWSGTENITHRFIQGFLVVKGRS